MDPIVAQLQETVNVYGMCHCGLWDTVAAPRDGGRR
jgi:hypothetical protein